MLDSKMEIAGLSVVLRPAERGVESTPLTSWLAGAEPTPIWVGLSSTKGVTKVMPVLPQPDFYPVLLQSICERLGYRTVVEWQGKPYEVTGVEVDTQTLHVLELPLTASKPLPPTLGEAIHALFFQWVAVANPALAEELYLEDNLPVTLGIKPIPSLPYLKLRIGIFQKELLAPLLWGLSQNLGGDVTLGKVACRRGKGLAIERGSSFEELAQIPPLKFIELQFLSPASFKRDGESQPFPLPELVFESLRRRWNAFAPDSLQFPAIEWDGLVGAFELKSHARKMEGGSEIGAQGWVRYVFPNSEQAAIATVLANFALFAGVGRGWEMGLVKLSTESRQWD